MADKPKFTDAPVNKSVRVSANNAARDGSGTINELYTAGAGGARIEKLRFISAQAAAAASSANVGRVFVKASGGSWWLYDEIELATKTPSGTVAGQKQDITYVNGLILEPGAQVGVTLAVYAGAQDQYDVHIEGGEYTA